MHSSSNYNSMTSTQDQDTSGKLYNYSKFQEKPTKPKRNSSKIINNILFNDEKHPVTKLNEIMMLLNKTVEYSMEINEELTDVQNFKCIAKCDCINVYGTGKSKKDAKKNAASAFISELISNYDIVSMEDTKNVITEQEVNCVDELHNLCMSLSIQLPDYEYTEGDKNNNNMFNVKCLLYGYTTEGEGKSKKAAKRKATDLMFYKIKDLPKDRILKSGHDVCQISISENIYNNDSHTSIQSSSFTRIVDEHDSFDQIKSSKNPTINRLRKIKHLHSDAVDNIQMLTDIAKEEGFTIHYETMPDKLTIKVQVNLSISPTLIHVGFGMTTFRALSEASFQVLVYLKAIMNKLEQF